MTLDEFYEENENKAKAEVKPTVKVVPLTYDFDDEVLPPNVIKTYIQGEIVYVTITEDGRQVRIDEWNIPY